MGALSANMYLHRDGDWEVVLAGDELVAIARIPTGNPNENRVSVTIIRHAIAERIRLLEEQIERMMKDL